MLPFLSFPHAGDDSLVRPNDHLPGAAFSLSVQKIWEVIRTQKDLNLPAHKVWLACARCNVEARGRVVACLCTMCGRGRYAALGLAWLLELVSDGLEWRA